MINHKLNQTGLLFLSLLFILIACSEKESIEPDHSKPIIHETPLFTLDFTDFSSELDTIWSTAYDVYGMEALCSCNCDRIDAINGMFNNYSHLSSHLEANYWDSLSCNDMMNLFSNDCNYGDLDSLLDFAISRVDSNLAFMSIEEYNLITNLLNDLRDGQYDLYQYRIDWSSLTTNSTYDNVCSLITIETSISVAEFVRGNPGFDDPEIAELTHLAGAVIGAATSLYVESVWGVITGEGVEDVGGTLLKGAIAGAIGAI